MTTRAILELDGEQWIRIITAASSLGTTSTKLKKIIVEHEFEYRNIRGQKTLYMRYADFQKIVRERI